MHGLGGMKWWGRALLVAALASAARVAVAGGDVFAVPDTVRHMKAPQEEVHVLRALADGRPLGEQRTRAVVTGDVLALDVTTRFASGESWEEHAELGLVPGYRARAFHKVARRGGRVIAEEDVDFATGEVRWLIDGVRGDRTLTLGPGTFVGPMLGVVLAEIPERAYGTGSIEAIVFRPEPNVYTLRADVVDQEDIRVGAVAEPCTKVRVKADLGPVQNALFASFIPTHYFWFTRDDPPEFLAFEGSLGYGGPELRMVPLPEADKTARAEAPPTLASR